MDKIMEKPTVSTLEMIKALRNDCGLEAITNYGTAIYIPGIGFRWKHSPNGTMILSSDVLECRWIIKELRKKLKEMSTQEIAKHYSQSVFDTETNKIKSLATGRNMKETMGFTQMKEEEIEGLWTVEGIYEDD